MTQLSAAAAEVHSAAARLGLVPSDPEAVRTPRLQALVGVVSLVRQADPAFDVKGSDAEALFAVLAKEHDLEAHCVYSLRELLRLYEQILRDFPELGADLASWEASADPGGARDALSAAFGLARVLHPERVGADPRRHKEPFPIGRDPRPERPDFLDE